MRIFPLEILLKKKYCTMTLIFTENVADYYKN